MPNKRRHRLNHMGVAVWLFYRSELPGLIPVIKPELQDLSKGKQYVLKKQAEIFLKRISDPLLRQYFCTIGSGQGLVIRNEETRAYELSPFFKLALERVPPPEEDLDDEIASKYVSEVTELANHLRGLVRSGK